MKRRHFLSGLGAAASLLSLAPAARLGAAEAGSGNKSFRVLICNIRTPQAVDGTNGDGWEHRRDFFREVVDRAHPDIVLFQECIASQFADIRAFWPAFHSYGLRNEPIIFSDRFSLVTAGGYWLSETPHVPDSRGWDAKFPRVANWVALMDKVTGREFRVANTHFDHIGQEARRHAADMLVQDALAYAREFPQILGGDFNASIKNPALLALKAGGWQDSYADLHGPADPGFTSHRFLGEKYVDSSGEGKIDFIFYRGAVRPLASVIMRDQKNGRYPSDHYFVSADFEFAA